MSERAPSPATGRSSRSGLSRRSCLLILLIVGGVLLLTIALAMVISLGLRNDLFKDLFGTDTNPGMPVEVVKLTPTAAASPLPPPSCETIISSGDVQVAVSLPISLTVGGETFPVVAVVPGEGGLTYTSDQPGSAAWVCGTVVNYILLLEPTPDNETLLANLRPGDEIKLHLSNGVGLQFRFAEQQEVAANEQSVLEQMRPRLTLILERDGGVWQVAIADYVAETEPVEPPSGTLAQPGTPVRVGDAQVTVTRGYAERGGADLLPGTMYYLVEFSVENIGTVPLDANAFNTQLEDSVGNEYLVSPAASAAGEHGPLSGEIAPGATAQGTAGYLVPDTLAGPSLIWTFAPRSGSELRAKVSISYEPGEAEPETAAQAEVDITDAFLSSDGEALVVEGEVGNVGQAPLTVEQRDISLTSSAGISELRLAAPPLPWTIQPGETQVIELQYTKPDASAALLALLGYSFEIQGLQR